jgi:hypothetical protein
MASRGYLNNGQQRALFKVAGGLADRSRRRRAMSDPKLLDEIMEELVSAAVTDVHARRRFGRPLASKSYRACSTKQRRTKSDVQAIRDDIRAILDADNPMTVRQVFYQLVVRGTIEKTEKEYQGTVIRLLTDMRMAGTVQFSWIIDESRRTRQTRTFDTITNAVRDTAKFYRRSALRECPDYVEIWCEKEALSGIIWDVASDYDVPVVVSKGMPSLTQVFDSFTNIYHAAEAGKSTYIYQFGDHDPSGVLIPEALERRLDQFSQRYDCPCPAVERVSLTEEQIAEFNLPTRPTKREGNTHADSFEGESTELDALPAPELRRMVRESIEQHISPQALETLRSAEKSEREIIKNWADGIGG